MRYKKKKDRRHLTTKLLHKLAKKPNFYWHENANQKKLNKLVNTICLRIKNNVK